MAPDGAFVVCESASQVPRVHRAADAADLAVTRRVDVVPREGKPALFSVYVMRPSAGPRVETSEPPIVVRDRTGRRTDAFRALRGDMGMPP